MVYFEMAGRTYCHQISRFAPQVIASALFYKMVRCYGSLSANLAMRMFVQINFFCEIDGFFFKFLQFSFFHFIFSAQSQHIIPFSPTVCEPRRTSLHFSHEGYSQTSNPNFLQSFLKTSLSFSDG